MIPSYAQRYSTPFLPSRGTMQTEMYPRRGHFVAHQHYGVHPEIPSVAESLADYQMAHLVMEARMRAQMRIANFFQHGKMEERRHLLDGAAVRLQSTPVSPRQIVEPRMPS